MKKAFFFLLFVCNILIVEGNEVSDTLFVSKNSTVDFPTIADAIASLPMYCYHRVVIYVRNGSYNEKIKIDRDYISLIGESRENTRIEFNQLRENWVNNKDDIGPAVVNIYADDIVIKNLTIENTQPEIGPHAFAIYGTGTRTILKNCTVLSKGGDTVSLWDYKTGMYYHDSCHFQGAVDFVCPRGWCFISNSTFYEVKNTAAIWHAAPADQKQKFVLQNCDFQGADSFYLARHHYEAQFYFLNCSFPNLMQNKSIEHVVYKDKPEKNRPYIYGDRYYFYKCSRTGGSYSWFADNLENWPDSVTPNIITPQWTFDGKWNPTDTTMLEVLKKEVHENSIFLWFSELVMPVGNVVIETESGKQVKYFLGSGRDRLEFKTADTLTLEEINKPMKIISGKIRNIQASVQPRFLAQPF
ncbi:MAG: pectinesterase family protein [Salinivirgaceae bacterium]|nr:pectinesterase family protein [Salinivirgaceae bacterium]